MNTLLKTAVGEEKTTKGGREKSEKSRTGGWAKGPEVGKGL